VLDRERLERALVDRAALLGLAEECLNRLFEDGAQLSLLPAASWRRRSKRSMRPPVTTLRSTPVYAGWQFEQASTTSSLRVERVVNVSPHEVQRTDASISSG